VEAVTANFEKREHRFTDVGQGWLNLGFPLD